MRILIIHSSSTIGGAELSLLEFLSAVRPSTAYRFCVACPRESLLGEKARALGIDVQEIDLVSLRKPRVFSEYLAAFLRVGLANLSAARLLLRYRPHVIHANNSSAFVQSAFAARFVGIPIIWHIRDSRKLPRGIRFLEQWASRIISVSMDAGERVLRSPKRALVVHNGLALTRSGEFSQRSWGQKRDYEIITVAQFVPWKRHSVAVEVVAELRNRGIHVRAALVGAVHDGSNNLYIDQLKQKVRRLGLQNQIDFLPETERIYDLIRTAQVLLHPAIDEPMGRVVAEAMLLGVPVVASRSGGIPEFIESGKEGILVAPDDLLAFADAIIEALDEKRGRQLALNARQRALAAFDLDRQTSAVLSVYEESCARGQQPKELYDLGYIGNSTNT